MNKHVVNLFVSTFAVLWFVTYWVEFVAVGTQDKFLIRLVCLLLYMIYFYLLWVARFLSFDCPKTRFCCDHFHFNNMHVVFIEP